MRLQENFLDEIFDVHIGSAETTNPGRNTLGVIREQLLAGQRFCCGHFVRCVDSRHSIPDASVSSRSKTFHQKSP